MKELKTEIILHAGPATVYAALTDMEKYAEWNPFIIRSSGTVAVGNTLTNTMLSGKKEMTFKPVVTRADQDQAYEWLGSGLMGMFKGRHYFILEDLGNGQTRLIHGEKFSGLLSGIVLKMVGDQTLQNFQAMNQALKERVERA